MATSGNITRLLTLSQHAITILRNECKKRGLMKLKRPTPMILARNIIENWAALQDLPENENIFKDMTLEQAADPSYALPTGEEDCDIDISQLLK